MKLLLTSDGLGTDNLKNFFISILSKEPRECSLLLVYYKVDKELEVYVEYTKEEIRSTGITKITPFDLHEEKFLDHNKKFDIIWVCGGNTFLILDRMKKIGIFDFIKRQVFESNSLYVGVSAGSIIAGPNIEVSGPWDDNSINLQDTSGMKIVDFATIPHYQIKDHTIVERIKNKANYKIIEITDEEAIFINENNYKIIK